MRFHWKKIIVAIWLPVYAGCGYKFTNGEQLSVLTQEEIAIINIVFEDMLEPKGTFLENEKDWNAYEIEIRNGFAKNPLDSAELQKTIEASNKEYDTARIFLYVHDSLTPAGSELNTDDLSRSRFSELFRGISYSYKPLVEKLDDPSRTIFFDMRNIKVHSEYIVESFTTWAPDDILPLNAGHLFLSRPAINKQGTKACMYAVMSKAFLNAYGAIFFLAYEDGVWKIKTSEVLWVA